MKTYLMHAIHGDEQFHVSTDSSKGTRDHAWRVFSAVCEQMLYGFGDAKSWKLHQVMDKLNEANPSGFLNYSHQGYKVQIKVEVQ